MCFSQEPNPHGVDFENLKPQKKNSPPLLMAISTIIYPEKKYVLNKTPCFCFPLISPRKKKKKKKNSPETVE